MELFRPGSRAGSVLLASLNFSPLVEPQREQIEANLGVAVETQPLDRTFQRSVSVTESYGQYMLAYVARAVVRAVA